MNRYVTATYWIKTENIHDSLTVLTRGQSVGNPWVLTPYETREFLEKWCATGRVLETHPLAYLVRVSWPMRHFGHEGVNYLLSVLMGGQCDCDIIQECYLVGLDVECLRWPRPRFGMSGIRALLRVPESRALCAGIIKPKIGLTPTQLAKVVLEMAEGGCDVIKEDEILANQHWCSMKARLPLVAKVLEDFPVLYLVCVTGDGQETYRKAQTVARYGERFGVHCNLWAGLGTYRDLRKHVPCPVFFQKSGDKVWTTGPFSIDDTVLCQLVHLAGCDFAHVGMYGGYLAESVDILQRRIKALSTTIPSFSCGMTPVLAEQIVDQFGPNVMVTSGGWVHGQPEGITPAARRLRRACGGPAHTVSPV